VEFDRRHAAQTIGKRDLAWRSRPRPSADISGLSTASLRHLKLFARHGGPSLELLRRVGQAVTYAQDECLRTNSLLVSRPIRATVHDHELP
jgi:hypothetical protein